MRIIIFINIVLFYSISCNNVESDNIKDNKNPSIIILNNEKKTIPNLAENLDIFLTLSKDKKLNTKSFNDTIIETDTIEWWRLIDDYIDSMQYVLEYQIKVSLPFGSKNLINHSFSKEGFVINKDLSYLLQPSVEEFFSIWNYYLELITLVDYYWICSMPLPNNVDFISLNNDTTQYYLNDNFLKAYSEIISERNQNSNLEFWYRFPNFGKYLTFYIAENPLSSENKEEFSPFPKDLEYWWRGSEHDCYGAFLFVDTLKSNAKFLPAFSFDSYSSGISFQFFYVTKEKNILIYKGESLRQKDDSTDEYLDEYKITLNKTHVISVDANNEIVIENLNNNEH